MITTTQNLPVIHLHVPLILNAYNKEEMLMHIHVFPKKAPITASVPWDINTKTAKDIVSAEKTAAASMDMRTARIIIVNTLLPVFTRMSAAVHEIQVWATARIISVPTVSPMVNPAI